MKFSRRDLGLLLPALAATRKASAQAAEAPRPVAGAAFFHPERMIRLPSASRLLRSRRERDRGRRQPRFSALYAGAVKSPPR